MYLSRLCFSLVFLCFCAGCIQNQQPLSNRNSQLTQGNVQLTLKVGKTTKSVVLNKFGAPNVITRDGSGKEVWTYQRSAQISQSSTQSAYWTIILAGQSGRGSGFETSSRMITLIIKFDRRDVVFDFKSRTSTF